MTTNVFLEVSPSPHENIKRSYLHGDSMLFYNLPAAQDLHQTHRLLPRLVLNTKNHIHLHLGNRQFVLVDSNELRCASLATLGERLVPNEQAIRKHHNLARRIRCST